MSASTRPRRPSRPNRPRRPAGPLPQPATAASLRFHLTEQLLEARRASWLLTNGAGPDEDVNAYLALRLAAFAHGDLDPRVVPGLAPLLAGPDPALPRAARADWYRANGDHRLLCLGLFGRGETCRRRAVPWALTAGQARERDLAVAAACYEAAARLLDRGPDHGGATGAVLGKLARHCEEYTQVLGVLAVRRLGLGARLDAADLSTLLPSRGSADAAAVATLLTQPPAGAVDIVLDLALEHRRRPSEALRTRISRLTPLAGLDAARMIGLPCARTDAA